MCKSIVYSFGMWDQAVSARGQLLQVNLRVQSNLFFLTNHVVEHDMAHCVNVVLAGVPIHYRQVNASISLSTSRDTSQLSSNFLQKEVGCQFV